MNGDNLKAKTVTGDIEMVADMMNKYRYWLLASLLCLLTGVSASAALVQNKLINFQGYLTNNANPPQPLNGNYVMTFKIYDGANATSPIWMEIHPQVTVTRGNVSVLLGSISPLSLTFEAPRYLGIQVGGEPEMIPRQQLLPAFQAVSANRLMVTHVNGSRSEFDASQLVPIGMIAPYFGNPSDLPANWKLCDGSVVNDLESPLHGKTLPDLKERFPRGVAFTPPNYPALTLVAGGKDNHTHSAVHSHSISPDGAHNHTGNTQPGGDHVHNFSVWTAKSGAWDDISDAAGGIPVTNVSHREHQHEVNGTTASASPYQHTHGIPQVTTHNHTGSVGTAELTTSSNSNLPPYVDLYYIIRIK